MKPVLYVEDHPDDVFFMRYAWEEADVRNPLVILDQGQQAIDYLGGNPPFSDRQEHPLPGLLVLDLKLPIKSGFEVLQWVRQESGLNGLKVIILSGSDQDNDMAMARALGITDYIVKPATPVDLIQVVRKWKSLWLTNDK